MIELDYLEVNVAKSISNSLFVKKPVKHHSALIDKDRIRDFIKALNETEEGTDFNVKNALIFSILTASRRGNIRLIKWEEIDFKKGTWSVQAEKMKSRRIHTIGLSRQAIEILKFQRLFNQGEYVFTDKGLSENTVNKFIHRLGFKGEMSAHGVRTMFRTICEQFKKDRLIAERCLAHAERDKLNQAYDRSENTPEMIEHKRELLQWYADYLNEIEPIKIVRIEE
ncbi:tyrosine-type recombinase/integrase [Campylobacter sp.]|uniref:tyrosine-type recombinase/integrase n=1 Tax=Campylobacter sp. TaxID=205 RepID=UPI002708DBF0|nr:site-specific integrase [Campylobacter sp.]